MNTESVRIKTSTFTNKILQLITSRGENVDRLVSFGIYWQFSNDSIIYRCKRYNNPIKFIPIEITDKFEYFQSFTDVN